MSIDVTAYDRDIDLLQEIKGFYDRLEKDVEPAKLYPAYLQYSDYSGSLVERSNVECFLENFGDVEGVTTESGVYGYEAIAISAIAFRGDRGAEIQETLDALSDYPLISDDHYTELCEEIFSVCWGEDGYSDFIRELKKKFDLSDTTAEFLEKIPLLELYYDAIPSGEYYIDENPQYIYIPIDRAVDNIDRDTLAHYIKEQKAKKSI
jgi:hypothetical protein